MPDAKGHVGIFGVPMDLGQDRRGVDMGPSAIRYARLQDTLEEMGYRVADLGNAAVPIAETTVGGPEDGPESVKHLDAVRKVCEAACAEAVEMVAQDAYPIFLGGDHSVAMGTVAGVAKASEGRTGVLWLDAHADFNLPETSPSGNLHGMPLAVLTGRGHPDLVNIGGEGPSVRAEDVVIVGLRSVDREERRLLHEAGVKAYTMKEIDAYGAARVMRQALKDLSGADRVHVSFDADLLDPDIAPGVGTPIRGGLTYREAHLLMELISEAGVASSLDVVEVNPILDSHNGTAELTVELVASLMGRSIIGIPE